MTPAPTETRDAVRFSIADLDYDLPPERIAQQPAPERDAARLLVLDRASESLLDLGIRDLPDLLRPTDLLVLNDTKVLPARFHTRRRSGGVVSGLFVREESLGVWHVLLEGSRRLKHEESLRVECGRECAVELCITERLGDGLWRVTVEGDCGGQPAAGVPAADVLARIGETPLPPYIRRPATDPVTCDRSATGDGVDRDRYQTVYARQAGAVAAPTAGLHFTEALLERLRGRGVETSWITLHVGPGTFKPISADDLGQHAMHSEWYQLPAATAAAIAACRARRGRVVAVGTTSVRVLETCAEALVQPEPKEQSGETDIFIYPPYRFRAVDGLLTNFHLPRSTLLALVMAFAGTARIREAYAHAMEEGYRFYSYGDAMLIL